MINEIIDMIIDNGSSLDMAYQIIIEDDIPDNDKR